MERIRKYYWPFCAVLLSLVFFFYAIISNVIQNLDDFYNAVSSYSGLYTFTLAICVFWATLMQINIFQANNSATLRQIENTQQQFIDSRNSIIRKDTLDYCRTYFEDLQNEIKELLGTNMLSGTPINWLHLDLYTSEELREKYPRQFAVFSDLAKESRIKGLLILNKLESFSAVMLLGNLDLHLANKVIGNLYVNQIGAILGIVAFYRSLVSEDFGNHMLALYKQWRTDELAAQLL